MSRLGGLIVAAGFWLLSGCFGGTGENALPESTAVETSPGFAGESQGKGLPTGTPNVMPNESTEPAGVPLASGELQLKVVPTDWGFSLQFHSDYFLQDRETVLEGNRIALPFLGRVWTGERQSLRMTIEWLDLELRKSVATATVSDVIAADEYQDFSAMSVVGTTGPHRLLYVGAANEGEATKYYIGELDLESGRTEILLDNTPAALGERDFFARKWFSPGSGLLMVNAYESGRMEAIDLDRRTVGAFKSSFPHGWPLFMTMPSPDGDVFWYQDFSDKKEFRLYDLDETLLATVPYPQGMIDYPAWLWSPDSRYAALYDTLDDDPKHVIDSEEAYNIAPQRIRFYDKHGRQLAVVKSDAAKDEYVEIAGWLSEGRTVLLRIFHLDRQPGRTTNFPIRESAFQLYDLQSRTFTKLDTVRHVTELGQAETVSSKAIVDLQASRVWEGASRTSLYEYALESPSGEVYAIRNDDEQAEFTISRFVDDEAGWTSRKLPFAVHTPRIVGEHWLTEDGRDYMDLRILFGNE